MAVQVRANVTLSFILCRGIMEYGWVLLRAVWWLSRQKSLQAQNKNQKKKNREEENKREGEWFFTTSTIQTW